jgi:hypothetical protein
MQRLRFLHIPKTAGSTFTYILQRQYRQTHHFKFSGFEDLDREKFADLSEDEKKKIGLFTGHTSFEAGIKEADEALTITFLRDPVSRVKSFCQHVFEGKSPHLINDYPPKNFNLDAFLCSGNPELFNLQTRILIETSETGSLDPFKMMTTSEARELAQENLFNKIFRFGIQEYFDESLLVFADSLNWAAPYYVSLNQKKKGGLLEFKSQHIEKILELNQLDLDLYQLAKKHFETDAIYRVDRSKLEKFRKRQRLLSYPLYLLFCIDEVKNRVA